MSQLPDVPRDPGETLPERRLTTPEFEAVIRRAAELQARSAEEPGSEAVTEAEMLRIGKELGLSPAHLSRALAEVRGQAPAESGALYRLFGGSVVRAARTVPGEVEAVKRLLDGYLVQREYYRVKRRFAGRTVYEPASGVVASLGRAASTVTGRSPLLRLPVVEVSVEGVGEEQSYVVLATSLSNQRAGVAAGTVLGGGGGGGVVATALAIAVAPPAALLGVPVLAGTYFGMRALYGSLASRAQDQMESLLDRLEHGELHAPPARAPLRFG